MLALRSIREIVASFSHSISTSPALPLRRYVLLWFQRSHLVLISLGFICLFLSVAEVRSLFWSLSHSSISIGCGPSFCMLQLCFRRLQLLRELFDSWQFVVFIVAFEGWVEVPLGDLLSSSSTKSFVASNSNPRPTFNRTGLASLASSINRKQPTNTIQEECVERADQLELSYVSFPLKSQKIVQQLIFISSSSQQCK